MGQRTLYYTMPFYLEDLEQLKCTNPDCDHTAHDKMLFLNQQCHPGAGAKVCINAMEGVLTATCLECDAMVCEIAIASNKTHEEAIVGEEASRQLYAALVSTIAHYAGADRKPEEEHTVLLRNIQVITRYRKHYGIGTGKAAS